MEIIIGNIIGIFIGCFLFFLYLYFELKRFIKKVDEIIKEQENERN